MLVRAIHDPPLCFHRQQILIVEVPVEVVSPRQSRPRLGRRCRWYVDNGVSIALLVDPRHHLVTQFEPGQPERVLRGIEKALNSMIAQQAAANDATFVDTYAASIGHDACQIPTVRWVEPVVPAAPAAPVHPNQLGMTGAKDALVAALP